MKQRKPSAIQPKTTTRPKPLSAAAQTNAAKLKAALTLHQQGLLDQAEVIYREILQSQPQHFDALQLLAMAAAQRKNSAVALELFDQALKINPHHASLLNNRGNTLRDLKRYAEALENIERALKIKPDHIEALCNRGLLLQDLKRPHEALKSYEHALTINPDYAEALNNRGVTLQDLKRYEEALESYDRALMIKPYHAEALNNRGNVLQALKRYEAALQSYDHALAINPNYVEAHCNRGNLLQALKCHEAALQSYAHALNIAPNNAEAHWNNSLCKLLLGNFSEGWREYEWRWKTAAASNDLRDFSQPLWLGKESLENKKILLHGEQGLGDTIQFCRYATQVAALGAKVILEVHPSLKTLLKNLNGITTLLAAGEDLPDFDYHCPLLSLPLAFQTNLDNIAAAAYLQPNQPTLEKWATQLGSSTQKRVGLVWSGSVTHKNDSNRSISLEKFEALVDDQATFYCLQKELRADDETILKRTNHIKFLGNALNDFSDTAALISLMDLVITVDTSVAHLAGALGKEVWILLPFNPDWRWLLDRNDSPWYQSARLFRQPAIDDWASVLAQVQAQLQQRQWN